MIALNITDLSVSCLSTVNLFCLNAYAQGRFDYYSTYAKNWHIFCGFPLIFLALNSCFITTILSASRTLLLVKPLFIINKKAVYIAYGVCLFVNVILYALKCALYFKESIYIFEFKAATEFTSVIAMVLTVAVSSIIAVKILKKPDYILTKEPAKHNKENSRNATIMILILSMVFVITNGIWCIFWAYLAFHRDTEDDTGEDTKDESSTKLTSMFGMFQSVFLIAINSAANPVVYLVKNSALNNYTKTLIRRFKAFLFSRLEAVKCA